MSRASGASFAQFFPSAPRAAKDKAKEREKVKFQNLDSPSIQSAADTKGVLSNLTNIRVEDAAYRPGGGTHLPAQDTVAAQAEDNESIQGDILNGVGSASSHTSTISSGFSAPPQQYSMTTFGSSQNVSSLTPLTNTDSSPSRNASPNQSKAVAPSTNSTGFSPDKAVAQNDVPQAQPTKADQSTSDPRVYARDPSRAVKGTKCTYDPYLDRRLDSAQKRKTKPIYKEFGLVRITLYNLRGASSCLCECLANGFAGR
jgi:histone-lysine N-methyltransferase SETD1